MTSSVYCSGIGPWRSEMVRLPGSPVVAVHDRGSFCFSTFPLQLLVPPLFPLQSNSGALTCPLAHILEPLSKTRLKNNIQHSNIMAGMEVLGHVRLAPSPDPDSVTSDNMYWYLATHGYPTLWTWHSTCWVFWSVPALNSANTRGG